MLRVPAHSYRAILIPATIQYDEVELQANQRLLPEIRLLASTAEEAAASAHRVSGHGVYEVQRIA